MNSQAGQPPHPEDLIDLSKILTAYDYDQPDPKVPEQQVRFGTSGHRGSAFDRSFNRNHILAITQAICFYRKMQNITGPLFLGFDTHALSLPAFHTALEVLAANDVTVMIAKDNEFTPTPVISHAILCYNEDRSVGLSDGIVITPSHNPPREGGFKYNPTHGGPAEKAVTDWIQNKANDLLLHDLTEVRRKPLNEALHAATTKPYDFLNTYVRDLESAIDFEKIRSAKIRIGADPLGGAGVNYWPVIADHYNINLTVINKKVDPRFRFMTCDWDGQIRMDPSSIYAMESTVKKAERYDITVACDTDHDRHGIVSRRKGLIPPNHYLAASIYYLFKCRPLWPSQLSIGKTLVSSQMIDRVGDILNRPVYEVPVGFKWFVQGLLQEKHGFAGEESAGATFLRKDGHVWTTDKDGIVMALLAAEMTANLGKDPAEIYSDLGKMLGEPVYKRIEATASSEERDKLLKVSAEGVRTQSLAGDKIQKVLTRAPGNNADIGGLKVETKSGWIAIRPSGTEDIYKIYGESFVGSDHLDRLLSDGQQMVKDILSSKDGENNPVLIV